MAFAQEEQKSQETKTEDEKSSGETEGVTGEAEEKLDGDVVNNFANATSNFFTSLELPRLWHDTPVLSWAILIGAVVGGVVIGKIVSAILSAFGRKWDKGRWAVAAATIDSFAGPSNLLIMTIGIAIGLGVLPLSPPLRSFGGSVIAMLVLIAVFWSLFNLVNVLAVFLRSFASKTQGRLDDQIIPLVRTALRILVVIIGGLVIVDSVFGADIGAALAGLGIAGLAVSLAAQDSLKNLFGSLTILLDSPFQIGERIVFQGTDGVVEQIGFRSTKVRTLVGHLVTVPNSAIVNESVENIGRRPFIRRLMNVTVTYDTPPDKIEEGIQIIRDILASEDFAGPINPTIKGDEYPPRVYFNDYNSESLNIMVIYWYAPPAYWDYLDHAQRFNFALLRKFEEAGIEFAFPTQTLYLAGDQKRELSLKMLGADLPKPPVQDESS
ncbi:mechanosensitive ion channel family protein [Calycomorphotria hydatis]|uniref:Low conductance mechanosensitive channel YnaI n=1 Tax=Calycomorphotria hydatis TaxID=2528027 RepID=A0A517T8C1_9PLAN|nr:mechanosensitive ion channel family protein [Calycomorphotria hydatis]QDT64635.1 Low conductance mechanosensitive channel YnaI [Calycomorphotria hydatis]